jgi:hypothetical protein
VRGRNLELEPEVREVALVLVGGGSTRVNCITQAGSHAEPGSKVTGTHANWDIARVRPVTVQALLLVAAWTGEVEDDLLDAVDLRGRARREEAGLAGREVKRRAVFKSHRKVVLEEVLAADHLQNAKGASVSMLGMFPGSRRPGLTSLFWFLSVNSPPSAFGGRFVLGTAIWKALIDSRGRLPSATRTEDLSARAPFHQVARSRQDERSADATASSSCESKMTCSAACTSQSAGSETILSAREQKSRVRLATAPPEQNI